MYDAPRAERGSRRDLPPRTSPSAAGWIALAIWALFAVLAVLLAVGVVGAFSRYTSNLRPPTDALKDLSFSQQSIVTDRNGVELARFGGQKRDVVAFADIPPIVVDAQVAVEDKTFWDNAGFDPLAILSAAIDSFRGNSRGASTITQQLVRQRLLDQSLVNDPNRTVERKIKEIVESIRLTQAYPGVEGKQQIIAAYLNQNYYGNQTYGVKAAAETYFGHPLKDVTPAEAATLAGLVKSPSNYDLVRNAVATCPSPSPNDTDQKCASTGKPPEQIVPPDAEVYQRRNQILELLANGRTVLSGSQYSPDQLRAAENDPLVVAPQSTPDWVAPHFVWAVLQELADKVCGVGVPTCDQLEAGGLNVTTTLDTKVQAIAEKWVQAAAVVPNSSNPTAAWKALKLPGAVPQWVKNLRGKDIHNGALVAIDYQTGELIAYVGSANYYAAKSTKQFQAKYDVVGDGFRQPGSAFKPFNYLTAIDDKKLTAGSMLMDVATDFGGKYTPSDADNLERGPVRVRNALQFSLNLPSVRAAQINTPDRIFARAQDFGMVFASATRTAGLSIALGVQEVRPVDLVTAYATLANGGKKLGHTTILSVKDQAGNDLPGVAPYQPPAGDQVASPQAAFIVTDILAGNTNPKVNPFWGAFELIGPNKERRPATLKTGTNNDAKDLNAYGFIAPPSAADRAKGEYALAVGAWNGNSDNTVVSTPQNPIFSIDVTTYVWQGFLQEVTKSWPVTDFARPDGVVQAKIDPFTGLKPRAGDQSINEWFIPGTEPQDSVPTGACGQAVLELPGIHEHDYANWMTADLDWLNRAKRGPGVSGGVNGTRTAYFYNGVFQPFGRTWGALVEGHGCSAPSPSTSCYPVPTPDPSGVVPSFVVPSADPSANLILVPCPTPVPVPSASSSVEPSALPTPSPTQPPTPPPPTPTPTPPPTATPAPTATPTAGASAATIPSAARERGRTGRAARRRVGGRAGRGSIAPVDHAAFGTGRIDLNADVGESFGPWPMGEDDELIPLVSSVNVACGAHAGDPATILRTVAHAARHGVAIGAHPGYPDLAGFGRRELDMSAADLRASLIVQVGAVQAAARTVGATVGHVKPHGALYNRAARDPGLAATIAAAIRDLDPSLVLVGLAGSASIAAGREAGLAVAEEAFADRRYERDGTLRSRLLDGALLGPADAAAQAVAIARDGSVTAIDGSRLAVRADTICIHGDSPDAVGIARAVVTALGDAGIRIGARHDDG